MSGASCWDREDSRDEDGGEARRNPGTKFVYSRGPKNAGDGVATGEADVELSSGRKIRG